MRSLTAALLILTASTAFAAEPLLWGDKSCAISLSQDRAIYSYGPTDGRKPLTCEAASASSGSEPTSLRCDDGSTIDITWGADRSATIAGETLVLSTDENGVCD